MTVLSKASLQASFQQGDVPTGTDYANFIDSCVNQAETSAQNIQSPIIATEIITPRVSATNMNVTGILSAATLRVNSIGSANAPYITGTNIIVSATNMLTLAAATVNTNATNINVSAVSNLTLNADNNANLSGSAVTVSAGNNMNINAAGGIFVTAANGVTIGAGLNISLNAIGNVALTGSLTQPVTIVSAIGTAQATGAICSAAIIRCKGVVDGQTTGFRLMSNKTGHLQYMFSDAVSANLWPPTGGIINVLAANAAFPMAVNTLYTVVHLTASAYAVK